MSGDRDKKPKNCLDELVDELLDKVEDTLDVAQEIAKFKCIVEESSKLAKVLEEFLEHIKKCKKGKDEDDDDDDDRRRK